MWTMVIGGAQRAVYQLVREQRRRGIHADLLIGSEDGYYGDLTREVGANVIALHQRNSLDFSVALRIQDIMKGYSIVHFHSREIGIMKMISRQPKIKRFYTHRGGVFHYPLKQLIPYKIAGYFIKKYFHGVSGNTAAGADSASKLFHIPREKISTTYNGVDFSLLDPTRSRKEVLDELHDVRSGVVRIGTSANLRDWKRIERLLEAVAQLRNRQIHCYIIGDGPAKQALERKTNELAIADCVTFTGKKEHIGDYLQILDIFVLPSCSLESFGNSVVEAMGVGLPAIIFSDGGGMIEHIEHKKTGFIVKDVADLTSTLQILTADPELRMKIGQEAKRKIREKYSLEKMIERYNQFYQNQSLWINI